MKNLILLLILCVPIIGLQAQSENPPAAGFNVAASDAKAVEIADAVMESMGGHAAWDNTRFIRWTFFERRTLLWDKWTGRVRIDFSDSDEVYLVDVHTSTGQIWKDQKYMTAPDSLATYLSRAKSIWINDSYWLVMPYKLKDSGVTLKYLGESGSADSLQHKLQLMFEEVGDTPENKYWIMVDDDLKLVSEWLFFTRFDDKEPRFSTPWADYEQYGAILLSGNRGRGQLTDIEVFEQVPDKVFEDAAAYDISTWK